MNTKIVYVLVSNDEDCYLEQTLISVYSCRRYNEDAHISVVLDKDTEMSLKGRRSEIKKYVTDFVVVDIPSTYNNMQRSRYLKTQLREFVSGDFLYVDSDTVVADDLSAIDSVDYDIAAVPDSNRCLPISDSGYTSDSYIIHNTNKLGWPSVLGYPNYNGGLLLVRECELSHKFYKRWYELWQECVTKGMNIDMPALCRTNIEFGCCIKELEGIWNCQIQRQGLPLLPEAKIIHCFTGGNITFYELCSERVLSKIKQSGGLDEEIRNMIENARTAFVKSTVIVPTEEAQLLELPICKLKSVNPFIFKVINKFASVLVRLQS